MKANISAPAAHVLALFTIIVWGTTFIASKLLLAVYSPLQIMLMRFAIAYVTLWIIRPKIMKVDIKTELRFAVMGIFGCTVYFLAENNALSYTLTSNVSILITTAPILTAIFAQFFIPEEKLHKNIILGFVIAISGVILVVFNGTFIMKLNPLGDLLSVGAAISWAIYSVMLRLHVVKFDTILFTRRMMFWGFITSLPAALIENRPFSIAPLGDIKLLVCVLFLGIIGSAVCYVFWGNATRRLGIVTVNNYIYVTPFCTMISAGLILHERISWMGIAGAVLILLGVFISDRKKKAVA